jgi:type II secretory pathway pseudopilin PulG
MIHKIFKNRGMILVNALVFAGIAITVTTALVNWGASVLKNTRNLAVREQAFQVAEAGIEYYRWHLAHSPNDFKDGTNTNGPYIHTVKDADGDVIGQYSLVITPPPTGSTLVKISSTGTVVSDSTVSRTIKVSLAIPSLAKYSILSDADVYFGSGTDIYGLVHSNGGIHFDAIAHNLVTSAVSHYNDTDYPGTNDLGVYTRVAPADPQYPATPPSRPDIFMAGRLFPVPAVDFDAMTSSLSQLKTLAQGTGGRYIASSGSQGYRIVLKINDTFDLYRVTSLRSSGGGCRDSQGQSGWGTWSINNQQFVANYPFPSNGIIFVEDHLWIEGQIQTARLTIATGRFPEAPGQYKSITINENLLYSAYDGTDVIGLIAQGDINVGMYSANNLRIDAALVAKNGRAGRYYYNDSCANYTRNSLTLFGMLASRNRYGFAYTNNTGYTTRNINYDTNLLYAPPPSFPLTSSQYQQISWEEF